MGCDIHLFVERKNHDTGLWEAVAGVNPQIASDLDYAQQMRDEGDFVRANQYERKALDIQSGAYLKKELEELEKHYPQNQREEYPEIEEEYQTELNGILDYYGPTRYKDWIYSGRNYDLFAILADVRNGVGFAGVDTGDRLNPITKEPRGIPEDISSYVKDYFDRWEDDGHSHSYLTVKELLDYDWNQVSIQRGYVSEEEFQTFKEKGRPDYASGMVMSDRIVFVTNIEMDMIVSKEFPKAHGKVYYTQISWEMPYYEAVGSFYTKSLPLLKELAGDTPEDVRIIFLFDN